MSVEDTMAAVRRFTQALGSNLQYRQFSGRLVTVLAQCHACSTEPGFADTVATSADDQRT